MGGNKRTSVLESGRYFGSSLLSPTTAVGDFRERQQNMHHGRYQTALPDVNNRYTITRIANRTMQVTHTIKRKEITNLQLDTWGIEEN